MERKKPVASTRSRPYRKNDNARVEQKNWTHVRQLVGYGRLGDPAQAQWLNELYAKEWGWFCNFFCPAMKNLRTEVEGSRKKRVYDKPQIPFERLEKLKATLNPFRLKEGVEKKLRRVLRAPSPGAAKIAA